MGGLQNARNPITAMSDKMPKLPNSLKSIRIPPNSIRMTPEFPLLTCHKCRHFWHGIVCVGQGRRSRTVYNCVFTQNREPQQGIQEKKGPEKGEHKQFHAKSEPLPPQASFQKAFLDDIALCSELFQQLFLPPLTRSVTYEHTVFSLVLFSLWA